jgi:hypothetical protein
MLMDTSLWFEGRQDRARQRKKGFGDDFSTIDDIMMEDRILSWTASAQGKYVGGLLLIFIHCFRGFLSE